jgi:hypothetical protein
VASFKKKEVGNKKQQKRKKERKRRRGLTWLSFLKFILFYFILFYFILFTHVMFRGNEGSLIGLQKLSQKPGGGDARL